MRLAVMQGFFVSIDRIFYPLPSFQQWFSWNPEVLSKNSDGSPTGSFGDDEILHTVLINKVQGLGVSSPNFALCLW